MTDKITVLLVDDHALVRRGFRRLLEDDPDIQVVGEGSNGDEAHPPDGGAEAAGDRHGCGDAGNRRPRGDAQDLAKHPKAAILMLSMHSEETLVRQALTAGARGYVLKNALELDLAAAVKRVAAGEQVLDPALVKPDPLPGERNRRLTPRELEVLQLICDGLSNKEIAVKLDLSANTVAVHRANIMNTLGVHKTAELVVYALQNGLVNPL